MFIPKMVSSWSKPANNKFCISALKALKNARPGAVPYLTLSDSKTT